MIEEKTDDVITPTNFDSSKLGEQELIFKVEKEELTKEFTVKVSVTDTKGAEITFKEDAVSLEYGAEFDVKGNIESVKDPVDGDVPFAESAGENNYYIIEGSVDTSIAGEYTITLKAKDKNGIESEKTYTVSVAEEYVAPQAPANNGGCYTHPNYQQTANGGGNSSSGSGGSAQAPAPTCVPGTPREATPNGIFKTNKAAWDDMVAKEESGTAGPVFDTCGNVIGYTKVFH